MLQAVDAGIAPDVAAVSSNARLRDAFVRLQWFAVWTDPAAPAAGEAAAIFRGAKARLLNSFFFCFIILLNFNLFFFCFIMLLNFNFFQAYEECFSHAKALHGKRPDQVKPSDVDMLVRFPWLAQPQQVTMSETLIEVVFLFF